MKETMHTKIGMIDNVGIINLCTKYYGNQFTAELSAQTWNIMSLYLFNAQSIHASIPFFLAHLHRSHALTNFDG